MTEAVKSFVVPASRGWVARPERPWLSSRPRPFRACHPLRQINIVGWLLATTRIALATITLRDNALPLP